MADLTKIAWTDATWNIFTGCTKVSEGCRNCYAERDWARLSTIPGSVYFGRDFSDVQFHPERLSIPANWKRPRKIFVNSMSDLFHESVSDDARDRVFEVFATNPRHIFQVLTKRPRKMSEYWRTWTAKNKLWLKNVWAGITVEDQKALDERIKFLFDVPVSCRWLSIEPMIGPVDIRPYLDAPDMGWPRTFVHGNDPNIDILDECPQFWDWCTCSLSWVVVGGESGPHPREMNPKWARDVISACKAAKTPVFFKQGSAAWGTGFKDFDTFAPEFQVREFPDAWYAPGVIQL